MSPWQVSRREERLLSAALNPDGDVAAASWKAWASEIRLENATYPELRLLTAVYAHLRRVAPSLELPNKLRGKAKATFTENNMLLHGCLPILEKLGQHSPVLLAKGAAICIRFGAWSSRAMDDVDIYVKFQSLEELCELFAQHGWTPKYGMTWRSLVHRSSLRRHSWNLAKGRTDLDLHWRFQDGREGNWIEQKMWASAERVEVLGHTLLLQSPEFAFVTALNHGFKFGTRRDMLQTIVDAASLLPVCRADLLIPLLKKMDLIMPFKNLAPVLDKVGLSDIMPHFSARLSPSRTKTEKSVLRRPIRYHLWAAFGRKSWIERQILRWTGPLSKPLTPPSTFREDYDLCDCEVIDQIGGPGWSWPEPDQTCFWSDRIDARLLIPLKQVRDHLIVLGVSEVRHHSPNPSVSVFANGTHLTTLNIKERLATAHYCFLIPRRVLFGPWVELSLRPNSYLGDEVDGTNPMNRSIPVDRLLVFDMDRLSEFFSSQLVPHLHLKILKCQEPQASKFERIRRKIETSPYQNANELPIGFDPVLYVLSHADLFEHEEDPYAHFILQGRHEGRPWYPNFGGPVPIAKGSPVLPKKDLALLGSLQEALDRTQKLALERAGKIDTLQNALDDSQALATERAGKIDTLQNALDDTQALARERAGKIDTLQNALDDSQALATERGKKIDSLQTALDLAERHGPSTATIARLS